MVLEDIIMMTMDTFICSSSEIKIMNMTLELSVCITMGQGDTTMMMMDTCISGPSITMMMMDTCIPGPSRLADTSSRGV